MESRNTRNDTKRRPEDRTHFVPIFRSSFRVVSCVSWWACLQTGAWPLGGVGRRIGTAVRAASLRAGGGDDLGSPPTGRGVGLLGGLAGDLAAGASAVISSRRTRIEAALTATPTARGSMN